MEQSQLAPQLELLAKKFEEAQATVARLQQRVESQEYLAQQQAHQIQQLEAELDEARTRLVNNAYFEEQLTHVKGEILQFIERRYPRNEPLLPDTNLNLLNRQIENQTQAINDIRREVEKTHRFDDQIALARTETSRLNQEMTKFQPEIDKLKKLILDKTNPIQFLEEQRQKNLYKLAELEAQLPDLHKKVEASMAKITMVAQQVPQFAKYEVALDTMRAEIREYREHMDFQLAQRERQLKDWSAKADAFERRIREIEASMENYTEFYQLNKRALASLQDFQERLQRDQHRFGELQRLAEERQRAETEKFQAEFEQRWQKQSMELQPQFAEFQKGVEALQKQIDQFVKYHQTVEQQLNLVLQIIEEDIQSRALAALDWQRRFEEIAEGQS